MPSGQWLTWVWVDLCLGRLLLLLRQTPGSRSGQIWGRPLRGRCGWIYAALTGRCRWWTAGWRRICSGWGCRCRLPSRWGWRSTASSCCPRCPPEARCVGWPPPLLQVVSFWNENKTVSRGQGNCFFVESCMQFKLVLYLAATSSDVISFHEYSTQCSQNNESLRIYESWSMINCWCKRGQKKIRINR